MMKKKRIWLIGLLLLSLISSSCKFTRALRRGVGEAIPPTITAGQATNSFEPPLSVQMPPTPTSIPNIEITSGEDGHPHLFFNAEDIPALQAKIEAQREVWGIIQNYVSSELGTSPKTTIFSRNQVETYRAFGDQLIAFAFVCSITHETRSCDLARTYLLTFASWDQWGEKQERSLGHAHMLMGTSLAYDWLYSILSPEERQMVRESLAEWAQKMYEASASSESVASWNNWWRKAYVQNHYFITNSALGMAGLALIGEDERAQSWIDHATERMSRAQYMLNGIADGSWHEGMSYQGYGLSVSLPFMVNLRKMTGVDIIPHDYLRNYAYWRVYNHLPGGTDFIMLFGDVDPAFIGSKTQNVLRFIASEYDDGLAEWMAQQLIEGGGRRLDARASAWAVFEFLYYDPTIQPQPPTNLEMARVFPDLGGVIWRTGWETDDLVFGLKAGPYGGRFAFETFTKELYPWEPPCPETRCQLSMGHDHADANTFYLYRAGAWLATEMVEYGGRDTGLHNTLLIDGEGQYWPKDAARRDPRQFINGNGFLEATANTLNFNYVAADATGPYRAIAGLEDFTRHVIFIRPDYFVMLDNLEANAAHRYEWISHFGADVTVDGQWIRGSAANGQALGVQVVAPESFKVDKGNDGLAYVSIQPSQAAADVRFIHVLYPTEQAAWNNRPNATLLADTGQAAALQIQLNDSGGRMDEILITYGQPGASLTAGPYTYDGRVAVVGRGTDGQIERLFIYGATFLQDQAGIQLVSNLEPTQPFEAIFSGSSVAVSGDIQTEVTLYAPQVENLIVNGQSRTFIRSNEYITFGAQ